jgi:hypothetical protein
MQEVIMCLLLVAFGFLCGTIYSETSVKNYVKNILKDESYK